jgi:hypothetical protein
MKSGELALALGIDKGTLYKWTAIPGIAKHLSPGALGQDGATQRVYNEGDVLVVNTVRHLRSSGTTNWEEIASILDAGTRVGEFPQNAISTDPRVVPMPQAKQAADMLVMQEQRDAALAKVEEYRQLVADYQQKVEALQELRRTEHSDLYKQIGALEAEVRMLKERLARFEDK